MVGIALYPIDGATEQDVVKRADEALYEVMRQGKRRYQVAMA
jgi:GGDEF domain-containing protein